MAKKIAKSRVATPLSLLFVELLIPWLIMALVAVLLVSAGLGVEIVIAISLVCAIGATFLIREFEKFRKGRLTKDKSS